MIQRISFRTAANGGYADAIGVTEVNLEGGDRLAVLHFHQSHPVSTPDFPKGAAFGKQGGEAVAIGRHRLWTDGVQRNQDVVASISETADPALRITLAGIAHQFRAFGGADDKRSERPERKRGDAILDFQSKQPGPG